MENIRKGWYALTSKRQYWKIVLIVLLFLGLFYYFCQYSTEQFLNETYSLLLDPVIALGTFILATAIGLQNTIIQWENGLQKKLTVHFKIKEDVKDKEYKYLLTCHEIHLFGEGDIRQWAMQIGSQMTNGSRLKFLPYVEQNETIIKETIIKDDKIMYGKRIKLFEVTFYLIEPPNNSETGMNYIVWWNDYTNNPAINNKLKATGLKDNYYSIKNCVDRKLLEVPRPK